jgi:uncharacterized membrane protein YdjX (TVP38/TMEM64 family)
VAPFTSDRKTLRRRALLVLAVAVVVAAIALLEPLHDALLRTLDSAQSVIARRPVLGAALFVLLAAASAMLAFFSSAVLVPVVVYVWGAAACAALLWLGWILGGICAYVIGRHLGQPVVARLTSRHALARYQNKLNANTPFGLVLLFQLALPSELPGYALGMASYPFMRYLAVLGFAELPYVLGTVYIGESLVQRRLPALIAVGAGALLVSVLAWRALQRRLRLASDE